MSLSRFGELPPRSRVALVRRVAIGLVGCSLIVAAATTWADDTPADAVSSDAVAADHAAQMAKSLELFKSQVRPLLVQHCLKCHGGEKTKGEFDLTTREGLLKGGDSGPAVVAGKPGESLLVRLIRHDDEPNMPAEADKLPEAAIEQISAWIASGAAYDKPLVDAAVSFTAKTVSEAERQFWSFQPLRMSAPPMVANQTWCRTPVDRFVLARLEAKGLAPNGQADRRKLIRRAYFRPDRPAADGRGGRGIRRRPAS